MADTSKDTIYIDVDDEITTVIDKVLGSNKKLVALVLPKRASVFQSVVNMKLLKRKSDESKKNLVLVTAETSLLPLAGAVGIHVAKTLASKPEIPEAPVIDHEMVEAAEDEAIPAIGDEDEEAEDLKKQAQEEVGKSAKVKPAGADKDLDTIELDNSDEADKPTDTAMPAGAIADAKKKTKKNKSLKIPNFNKFRLWSILGIGAVVILFVLWLLIFKIFPHATINVKTDAQNVSANVSFNLSTTSGSLNKSTNTVPAKNVSETKSYTATANSTGTQNNGQQATGQVTLSLTNCSQSQTTIPEGTGIESSGGLTFITQSSVSLNYSCSPSIHTNPSASVNVTAQTGGSKYNISPTAFSVSGYSNVQGQSSSTFSGGTDDNVTIVSQADISNAENKISTDSSGAKTDLSSQLTSANYYPLTATFTSATPSISPNASAGTAASSVTVTETIKYSMYGAIKSDLNSLLNSSILNQVGSNQNILNNGLSSASYSVGTNPTSVTIITNAIVGPNINVSQLKKEITGKSVTDIKSIVKSDPDVSSVSVKLSPFYVSTAPGPGKITVNIAKPTNNPSNASTN